MNREYIDAVLLNESKTDPKTGAPFSVGLRKLHAHMGIITEVGEIVDIFKKHTFYGKVIDEVHLKKEIGDLLWYVALGLELHAWHDGLSNKNIQNDNWSHLSFLAAISKFSSFDEQLTLNGLLDLLSQIKAGIGMMGYDYEEILRMNTAKLNKRYKNGFTSKEAINRKENDV